MKIAILFRYLSALFLFLSLNSILLNAQEISSFEIIPANPSNTDEVFVIVGTTFPFLDCSLDSVNHFYACGAYALDAFYSTGFDVGECERIDTISLGTLLSVACIISFRMYYLGWAQVDQIDTFVTVGTVGIDHLVQNRNQGIKIWPNPSSGKVNISMEDESLDQLSISQVTGSHVQLIDLNKKSLNTVYLSPGTYICTAYRQKQPISISRLIILK